MHTCHACSARSAATTVGRGASRLRHGFLAASFAAYVHPCPAMRLTLQGTGKLTSTHRPPSAARPVAHGCRRLETRVGARACAAICAGAGGVPLCQSGLHQPGWHQRSAAAHQALQRLLRRPLLQRHLPGRGVEGAQASMPVHSGGQAGLGGALGQHACAAACMCCQHASLTAAAAAQNRHARVPKPPGLSLLRQSNTSRGHVILPGTPGIPP